MRHLITAALAVLILSLNLAAPVAAGPLEDGMEAFKYGRFETALRLIRPLAEQGNAPAQYILGRIYTIGMVVPQDVAEAVKWWRKAADQGYVEAQLTLAYYYSVGAVGVPQDQAEMVKWYRKAADQGNVHGQNMLGWAYKFGRGVPEDDAEAAKWYRKAADQGNASAQHSLGEMYEKGHGVAQNFVLAHMWYILASVAREAWEGEANRLRLARKNRDEIARRMTPQQIEQAQTLAAKWQPKSGESIAAGREGRNEAPAEVEVVSTGTGFFVARGLVVTNHHVTEDCQRLRVAGRTVGRILVSDAHNDLALIELQRGTTDAATIRVGRVKIGESATIAGFPLSGLLSSLNVTTGNVSSLSGIGGDIRLLQITAPVQAGNSGGPLLDANGNVMGVVVSKLNALKVARATGDVPQNVNFAINANVLSSFLDANAVNYKTASGGATLPTQEIARRAQAFTVLVECFK